MVDSPFADMLAARVEELVWIFAVQHEHDAGMGSISRDVLNTHFKPVFTELTGIQKDIQNLRRLSVVPRRQSRSPRFTELTTDEFLGLDVIPHELSGLSDDICHGPLQENGALQTALPDAAVPLKWHVDVDAVPDEFRYFDTANQPQSDDLEQGVPESASRRSSHPPKTSQKSKASDGTLSYSSSNRDSTILVEFAEDDMSPQAQAAGTGSAKTQIATTASLISSKRTAPAYEVLDVWQRGRTSTTRPQLNRFVEQSDLSAVLFTHVMTDKGRSDTMDGYVLVPLSPGSPYRLSWDLLSALFVFHDVVRIPMEFLDLKRNLFMKVSSWAVRIFWSLDLLMNFITGYVKHNGLSELRLREVLKRYAYTWMIPDILLVTFDWMEMLIWDNESDTGESETGLVRIAKSSRVLRILRALRLVRMGKALRLLNDIGFTLTSDKLVVVIDIIKILFLIIAFTHVVACSWCGLGTWESEYGYQTWLYVSNLQDNTVGDNYLVSCIWALSLFSGGTDFPLPQNVAERVFMSILLLICFVAAAGFVSLLTSATTKLLLMTSGPSKQMGKLRTYLSQNHISLRLGARIQRSAHSIAFERPGLHTMIQEEDVELLQSISEPLRTELAMEIRGPTISNHPFFATYNHCCYLGMRQLCSGAALTRSVAEGDILFMMGERQIEPRMFFLEDGQVSYQQQRQDREFLSHGEWVAEAVLWTDWTHPGTLIAVSACQVVHVVAKPFQQIVMMFSDSRAAAIDYAEEFVGRLNEVDSKDLSDLEWDLDRVFDFKIKSPEDDFIIRETVESKRKSILDFLPSRKSFFG